MTEMPLSLDTVQWLTLKDKIRQCVNWPKKNVATSKVQPNSEAKQQYQREPVEEETEAAIGSLRHHQTTTTILVFSSKHVSLSLSLFIPTAVLTHSAVWAAIDSLSSLDSSAIYLIPWRSSLGKFRYLRGLDRIGVFRCFHHNWKWKLKQLC